MEDESLEDHPDEDKDGKDLLLDFSSKVNFGVRLGYSEGQVRTSLMKLGPSADENELLAELIKLANSSGPDPAPSTEGQGHRTLTASASAPASNGTPSLRPIIIDGQNVAMAHGTHGTFSCRGIEIVVNWFKNRGHDDITVFVPSYRKEQSRVDSAIEDQHILTELEKERILVFTPSRTVAGKRVNCHDDLYILNLAVEKPDAIIVSNDEYRDITSRNNDKIDSEKALKYQEAIDCRRLKYSFAKDIFMPPDDPFGSKPSGGIIGLSLNEFLKMPSTCFRGVRTPSTSGGSEATASSTSTPGICPYLKKCTYGNKCKYFHPERVNQPLKSVAEGSVDTGKSSRQQQSPGQTRGQVNKSRETSPGEKKNIKSLCQTASLPPSLHSNMCPQVSSSSSGGGHGRKQPLMRTKSVVPELTTSPASSVSSSSTPLIMRSGQIKSGSYHGHPSAPQHKLHLLHPHSHHHHNPGQIHAPLTTSLSARASLFGPSSSSCTDFQAFSSTTLTDHCLHQHSQHHHQQPLLPNSFQRQQQQTHSLSMHSGQQQQQSSRFSQPPLHSCQHHPSHCCVAKRFSDPEKLIAGPVTGSSAAGMALSGSHDSGFSSKSYSESGESSSPDSTIGAGSGGGLHRKLARQLTLNPTFDPRLEAMTSAFKSGDPHHKSFPDESSCLFSDYLSQEQKKQQLPIGSQRQHQTANRLMSEPVSHSSGRQGLLQHPSSVKTQQGNDLLNRSPSPPLFASSLFPDRHHQQQPPHSPSGLNAGGPFSGPSIWSPSWAVSSSEDSNISPWNIIPDPVPYTAASVSSSNRSSSELSNEATSCLGLRSSLPLTASSEVSSSSSCAGQLSTDTSIDSPSASSSTILIQVDREKIFYHLSSLFPEDQVRTAMEMHPEETNAQVICATIISLGKRVDNL